jgi:hypothetical protein
MTQNEEENICYAIESVLNKFDQVIVTDAYSTDLTVALCRKYDGVEIYQHDFLSWADQRNWMLDNCDIRNDIVYFMDADEYILPDFIDELRKLLELAIPFDSIYLVARYIFLGAQLKYAYGHPKIKRIFKKIGLSFTGSGAREYANKEGVTLDMKSKYIHHDRKSIASWVDKHNRNSEREARQFLEKENTNFPYYSSFPLRLKVKLWVRNTIWDRLPLMVRPILYFVYRYIIQLGILDGRAGFIYCYLHAIWYQSLIDIKIIENKLLKRI